VRDDVIEQRSVSAEAARELYGVVITDGLLDRQRPGLARGAARDPPRKDGEVRRLDGEQLARITDNLDLRREKDGLYLCCAKCTADLGPCATTTKTTACGSNRMRAQRTPTSATTAATSTSGRCSASSSARVRRARGKRGRARRRPVLQDIELHLR